MKIKCEYCEKEFNKRPCVIKRNEHNFCSRKCMNDYLKIHPRNLKDLMGKKFGRLKVIEYVGISNHSALWKCKCKCGNEKIIVGNDLISGHTKSCGCYQRESTINRFTTHGLSSERLYNIWKGMIYRCENPKAKEYKNYGKRGITVCKEWHNVKIFIDWAKTNGYKDNLEIDRINNDGNYEPNNCKWSTRKEQTLNTRRNIKITLNGTTKTLSEWSEQYGFNVNTIQYRYYRGDRGEQLFRPINNICNWRLKKCTAKSV